MDDIITEVKNLLINARKAHYEYLKEQELEATEREVIISSISAITNAMKSRRDVAEIVMNTFFEERKLLREKAEDTLQKAIQTGDSEIAELALRFIAIVYSKNPFQALDKII